MRARFYASTEHVGMLKLSVDLGKPGMLVELADKHLNWNELRLTGSQVEKLKRFLNETPME